MAATQTYESLCARAQNSNVDATTLLATDYLNHLNEPVMLLEMLPDMPDLKDELLEWRPKSYAEHFKASAIADRDLAIEAYAFSPECYRVPFEFTIRAVTRKVESLRSDALDALEADDEVRARELVATGLTSIHTLLGVANAIIHGVTQRDQLEDHPSEQAVQETMHDRKAVDGDLSAEADDEAFMSQDEIDSLFD